MKYQNKIILNFIPILILVFLLAAFLLKPQKKIFDATNSIDSSVWTNYDLTYETTFKKQSVKSTKAIYFFKEKDKTYSYLVSLKRHDKSLSKKDGRYEFPGGKVDKKEKVITAIQRELSEEDSSQVLYQQFKSIVENSPNLLKYKLLTLKDLSKHVIFLLPIEQEQWKALKKYHEINKPENHETYGFEMLKASYFHLKKKNKSRWTPQSIRILKRLKKTQGLPYE